MHHFLRHRLAGVSERLAELDFLLAQPDVMADMSKHDAERLHAIITRHAHYTNSSKAKTILADWPTWQTKFKKVMPVEYRRALSEMAKVQAADKTGFDVMEIGVKSKSKTKAAE